MSLFSRYRRLFVSNAQSGAPALEESTSIEHGAVIRFSMVEQIKPCRIYCKMVERYGSSCMNRASFYSWVE